MVYLFKGKKKKSEFSNTNIHLRKKNKLFPNSCLDKLGVCCAIALWFYPWCTCSLQAAAACWACAGAVPLGGPQGRLARGGLQVPLPHGWATDMEKSRPSGQHRSEHLQISPAELLQIARVTLVEKSPFERQFVTS